MHHTHTIACVETMCAHGLYRQSSRYWQSLFTLSGIMGLVWRQMMICIASIISQEASDYCERNLLLVVWRENIYKRHEGHNTWW